MRRARLCGVGGVGCDADVTDARRVALTVRRRVAVVSHVVSVSPRSAGLFTLLIAAACDRDDLVVARLRIDASADLAADTPGAIPPRTCGTRLNPVGCACLPRADTTRACVTFEGPLCASGTTRCLGVGEFGVWGPCEGQRPGVCECLTEGETRECTEGPCGASVSVCRDGRWSACRAAVCMDAAVDRPDATWDGSADRADGMDATGDRPDVTDATLDAPDVAMCLPAMVSVVDCDATLAAPRPVAPLAFSRVTSRRPTVEWSLPSGSDGAVVEFCRDRACTRIIERLGVTGTSARPTCPLPAGVVFWRVVGRRAERAGCARDMVSSAWQMEVGVSDAGDTSWGVRFDANGDGLRDVILRSGATAAEPGSLLVLYGTPTGWGAAGALTTLVPPRGVVAFGVEAMPAGDVNGDGYGDLLARGLAEGTDDDVDIVYLGGPGGIDAASGREVERRYTLAGLENAHYATGDFDHDGYGDLVIVRTHVPREATTTVPRLMQPRLDVYRGGVTGPGRGPTAFVDSPDVEVYFGALTVGDFDGDRRPEIALGARGEVEVVSSPLDTPRIVHALRRPDAADSQRFGEDFVWTCDLNADGLGDLVVLGTGAIGTPGTWTWLGARGGFATAYNDRIASAYFWTPGDVNNDGLDDLGARVDGTGYGYFIVVGRNVSSSARVRVTVPQASSVVLSGDADGDGNVDLLARDRMLNVLLLYRGLGRGGFATTPTRSDLPASAPSGPSGNGAMVW